MNDVTKRWVAGVDRERVAELVKQTFRVGRDIGADVQEVFQFDGGTWRNGAQVEGLE